MTFHIGIKVKNKETVIAMLEDENSPVFKQVPESVKAFIREAINNSTPLGKSEIISISGSGHLCTGATSYDPSNCTVDVHKEYLHGIGDV